MRAYVSLCVFVHVLLVICECNSADTFNVNFNDCSSGSGNAGILKNKIRKDSLNPVKLHSVRMTYVRVPVYMHIYVHMYVYIW